MKRSKKSQRPPAAEETSPEVAEEEGIPESPESESEPEESGEVADTELPPEQLKAEYHVPGPGAIFFGGRNYAAGDCFFLTKEEADELGDAIVAGPPMPVRTKFANGPGLYRVVRGGIQKGGRHYTPHSKEPVYLTEEEAKQLQGSIEKV